MSTNIEPQRHAFNFLLEKCNTQELFTRDEFQAATGWADKSFGTYFSKQFKALLIPAGAKQYRVSFAFRRFATWSKFRNNVVTQNRRLTRDYKRYKHENVVVFEFYMPLRNEEFLRDALDGLFFKDSFRFRLKALEQGKLRTEIPILAGETEDAYLDRVCAWLSNKFVGYSISHVAGRYRSGDLKTREEAAKVSAANTQKYLIDETTAVVRFIFPCVADQKPGEPESNDCTAAVQKEASQIRWFFHQLFVGSILEVVSGEDEIWLLETGMKCQLHIYRADE